MEITETYDHQGHLTAKQLRLDSYDLTGVCDPQLAGVILRSSHFFSLPPGCQVVSNSDLLIQVPTTLTYDKCLEIQARLEGELTRLRALEYSLRLLQEARGNKT